MKNIAKVTSDTFEQVQLSKLFFEYNILNLIDNIDVLENIDNGKQLEILELKKKYNKLSAYEEFVNYPSLKENEKSILFELEVNQPITDIIDFSRQFLESKGYTYTGYTKDAPQAIYNDKYIFGGAIQDNNKIAIRLNF